jgi:hypothetical protein
MSKAPLLALALAFALATPAAAADITTKKACEAAGNDVRKQRESSDAGAKQNEQADEMIRVADHLCTQGNFVYAESVMTVIRTLLATK